MLLSALICTSCWASCWGWVFGAFVVGSWFGMMALALCVIGRDDHDRT
jgi:hypothetical protein